MQSNPLLCIVVYDGYQGRESEREREREGETTTEWCVITTREERKGDRASGEKEEGVVRETWREDGGRQREAVREESAWL
jgi:hypothetical protein